MNKLKVETVGFWGGSEDIFDLIQNERIPEGEKLILVHIGQNGNPFGWDEIAQEEKINASLIEPKDVFGLTTTEKETEAIVLIRYNAKKLVSNETDLHLIKKFILTGKTMQTPLMDYLIIDRAGNWKTLREQYYELDFYQPFGG